ncbi:MAG: hypothetical protein ABSG41_29905 [Bryobacteraceae bacterium]|jgi:hypothetical protein
MTPELERALAAVCSMKFPTVANLLRRKGYEYEAQQIESLVKAWEDSQQQRSGANG